MYFGATPFSAAAFSDVGFNPNAFANVVGNRLNFTIGNSVVSGDVSLSVTGNRVNIATSDVTIVAKAKTLPSGNRLNIATSDITLRMWEAVPTNATQTWTEIP